ncbi:hypothetical protein KIH23_13670, partial [Flavobacterium sp. CYK-55]|uniref:hypothetical protein n=2 Tax=Flavobacterium sp. CYK-55 TaxID=2835529 RepID=UPI001BCE1E98
PAISAQVTQPTCAVATGSFSVSNYDAAMTYTITPNVGVSMSNTGVVTAPAGTYTLTATASNGCTSAASASVTIDAQPETPATPAISAQVTQP